MDTAELIDTYREAERTLDLGDTRADAHQYRAAAMAYSKAAGLLLSAVDAVLAEQETADAR